MPRLGGRRGARGGRAARGGCSPSGRPGSDRGGAGGERRRSRTSRRGSVAAEPSAVPAALGRCRGRVADAHQARRWHGVRAGRHPRSDGPDQVPRPPADPAELAGRHPRAAGSAHGAIGPPVPQPAARDPDVGVRRGLVPRADDRGAPGRAGEVHRPQRPRPPPPRCRHGPARPGHGRRPASPEGLAAPARWLHRTWLGWLPRGHLRAGREPRLPVRQRPAGRDHLVPRPRARHHASERLRRTRRFLPATRYARSLARPPAPAVRDPAGHPGQDLPPGRLAVLPVPPGSRSSSATSRSSTARSGRTSRSHVAGTASAC